MKLQKKLILLISLFGIAVGSSNCGKRSFEDKAGWVTKKLSSKLDLEDSQKEVLEKIKLEVVAKHKELKPKNENWIKEMVVQVKSDKIDSKSWDKLGSERDANMIEMRKFIQTKFLEFHAVLNPKQKEELSELIEKWGSRFLTN